MVINYSMLQIADAANKKFVDLKVNKTGDEVTGNLVMKLLGRTR
jgi:hypothetical protein